MVISHKPMMMKLYYVDMFAEGHFKAPFVVGSDNESIHNILDYKFKFDTFLYISHPPLLAHWTYITSSNTNLFLGQSESSVESTLWGLTMARESKLTVHSIAWIIRRWHCCVYYWVDEEEYLLMSFILRMFAIDIYTYSYALAPPSTPTIRSPKILVGNDREREKLSK